MIVLLLLLSLSHTPHSTQSLHGRQDERVLHELKEWEGNFISVQQFMDDLAVTKGRVWSLQENVRSSLVHLF